MYHRPAPTPHQHQQQWPPQSSNSNAPPLPPKPELRSVSTTSSGSWSGGDLVTSPGASPSPHFWSSQPPNGDRPHSHGSPMIPSSSSVPRIGSAVPPDQLRSFDSGIHPEQVASPQRPPSLPGQSPDMGPYALAPPTPQMRGVTPGPQQSPYLSPVPRAMDGSSPPQVPLMNHSQSTYFSSPSPMPMQSPPPPPPPINRSFASTPAPPPHPPLPPPPPPLPAHQSEPQLHTSHAQVQSPNSTQARHLSLPPFPPPPPTPAPGAPPLATPSPSFPQPFSSPHAGAGLVRAGAQIWVGGIAPRPNTHYRSFQPDVHNMPPIPQATTPAPPPPPPLHAPPPPPPPLPPAVANPAIQMPMPVLGSLSIPPPLPPPPRHAATSPTIMTHGQWGSGGLRRTGTINPNAPPLPPKEPSLPPTGQSWPLLQQEPVLPPKEPILPPKEPIQPLVSMSSEASGSSSRLSPPPPSAVSIDERHEAELREALRMSLAMSPPAESEEDPELARALRESMREASDSNLGLNLGSGAWTPVLPRAHSPEVEVESLYQTRPPPPLPAPVAPTQELRRETPPVVDSPAAGMQPLQEDGPPPPTYEEVTGSRTATPLEPPLTLASARASPILGSVAPREQDTRNNLADVHPSLSVNASVPEPPVEIEIIPPSANNSIVRRDPQPRGPGRPERSSSEGNTPSLMPNEIATSPPPRRSTQSPPLSTARPRASSQTRARPVTEMARHPEPTPHSFTRPRVVSASQASLTPVSRLSRASMFFAGMSSSNLSLGSNEQSPRRTWAIDEEPGVGDGLLLQAPEPVVAIGLLRSRNPSELALHDSQADAPPTETLLDGVIYGFRDPDPPTPVPMPPADPLPPNISLDDSGAFHIQTLNFRHLLRLLSHYGSTNIMATPAAIAASKSGVHSARVVLHFVRGPHERDPWLCRLFLELHTPPEDEVPAPPDTTLLFSESKIIAPVGVRGKIYVVPGPLPQLPLSFQGLSTFLVNRLGEASRAANDSTQRRLERILVECYGSVTGAGVTSEEIGGRQKGSGNFRSLGGIFSKVKDKLSSDKAGNVNDHTYDLISPFHVDDYR